MENYTVIWEVRKVANVEANSAKEAEEAVLLGDVDGFEDELTVLPKATLAE